jgi:hypothetical protein
MAPSVVQATCMSYSVLREIGKGNFGVVSLVEDDDGHRWALKVFTPPNLHDVTSEELRARFEREVRYQLQLLTKPRFGNLSSVAC